MRHLLYGTFWRGVYIMLAAAPLIALLFGQTPPGRGFWREFSVGLGFAGLSMMGWQFFLTGRFKNITSPYGIDVVYHFHRLIALIAFLFILLHPRIIIISKPVTIALLNPLTAPWWITIAVASLLSFTIIIATSLYRIKLGIIYEQWRLIHGYISVIAVVFSMAHIMGIGYYVQGYLKNGLWLGISTAWILALIHIRIIKPAIMLRHPYRVGNVVKERGKSWTLLLQPDGHKGMEFKPGQFAWLNINRSAFSIREHPFSFSSSAMQNDRLMFTIKELGDFTSKIGEVAKGTRAYIDGPYGTFTIDRHEASGYVLIAGGIGITPIMSILRTMSDRNDKRTVLLIYGGKALDDLTFYEELDAMKKILSLRIVHILENAPEGWQGEKGFITADVMARHLPEERMNYEYFVCGPQPMQIAVKQALNKLGIPLERVQSESFNFV